jgi:nitric oxide reductase NorD protein
MNGAPLSVDALEERLERCVEAVLSARRTAIGPATRLAALPRRQQEFILRWVDVVAQSNAEMAFQVAAHGASAFMMLDDEGVQAWILAAMDAFDANGLPLGIAALREVNAFAERRIAGAEGLRFEDVAGVLAAFVRALSGRDLRLETAEETYTDTETLFLPAVVTPFRERRHNFLLYKAMAAHQWAQGWYGTWRVDVLSAIDDFDDREHALGWFHHLEILRLQACIGRDLPGLGRDMMSLASPPAPRELGKAPGDAADSLGRLANVYSLPLPPACCYQGSLHPERVQAVMRDRAARDRDTVARLLAGIETEIRSEGVHTHREPPAHAGTPRFSLHDRDGEEATTLRRVELRYGDRAIPIGDDLRRTLNSILQDLGQVPEDLLIPAGSAPYGSAGDGSESDDHSQADGGHDGGMLYDEWDHGRQHYRKNWCVLHESDVHPVWDDFVDATLAKHRGRVRLLRRSFEALRGEDKLLKREPHGDDLDIDAVVEAYADVRAGREAGERLFVCRRRLDRDIAVMFMVDMSGSTKGWINDAEREALVLLCEALQCLGDRYAIYGFSGMTRKRCEVYRIKRFDETYGDLVQARISGIVPQDYTRMGVTIRHLTRLLASVEARTKLLITLSDGKPDDYTDYRGEYGIEDTRQALIEAKRDGIHPFCITIDDQAGDYLPHMYGAVSYVVIDAVRKLPVKLSDIYRKLTA